VEHGDEIVVYTYASPSGVEVVFCKVKDQGHHVRRDLRDRADSIAIDFLFKHKRKPMVVLAGDLQPGTNEVEFQYDGHLRKMLVRLPADYSSEKKYPVVFGFHGAGGPMEAYHRQLEEVVKTHGVISVSPQGISNAAGKTGWNGFANHRISNTDDVGFVVETVDYLDEHASIDRDRLYATGGSSGAIFCFRLAMETELFAAIAPMRGAMIKRPPAPKGRPRLSILHVGGGDDPLFLGTGSADPAEVFYSWQDTMALWAANHGIESPELEEEAISEKVTITRYSPRESTFELLAYLVKDNGHKVEQAELAKAISYMGEFFMRHAKDSSSNSAGSATKKPAK
jgi:poly(3-hydroxybutyrate) depolymerase